MFNNLKLKYEDAKTERNFKNNVLPRRNLNGRTGEMNNMLLLVCPKFAPKPTEK